MAFSLCLLEEVFMPKCIIVCSKELRSQNKTHLHNYLHIYLHIPHCTINWISQAPSKAQTIIETIDDLSPPPFPHNPMPQTQPSTRSWSEKHQPISFLFYQSHLTSPFPSHISIHPSIPTLPPSNEPRIRYTNPTSSLLGYKKETSHHAPASFPPRPLCSFPLPHIKSWEDAFF